MPRRCQNKNLSDEGLMWIIFEIGRNHMEKGCSFNEKESEIG